MDIDFGVESKTIQQNSPIRGRISVSYPGRYDGVTVNTQVLDSNHHVMYTSCNGKAMASNVARLFIPKSDMHDNAAEFTAEMRFPPDRSYEIKMRASIIEQHKEIASSIVFMEYSG